MIQYEDVILDSFFFVYPFHYFPTSPVQTLNGTLMDDENKF